jgi:mono/diheme cytochrome c family protein
MHAGLVLFCLALLPPVLAARARVVKSTQPRYHVVFDMDNQEKYRTQEANKVFADGRAMRSPIPGTLARGELREDEHLNRGYRPAPPGSHAEDVQWFDGFPAQIPFTAELVRRGQDRFMIYCAPCHGYDGQGSGMVARRADELAEGTWVPPLSMLDAQVVSRPDGHIFNTITNGIRTMPSYDRIPVQDRWAIISYVRALQRSQTATIDDVPAEKRQEMLREARPAAAPATP